MICTCCGAYLDPSRNHVWRLELRDVPPRSDNAELMLGAALCQPCAISVLNGIKSGMLSGNKDETEETPYHTVFKNA